MTALISVPIPPQSLRDIWPGRCQAQIKNQLVSLLLSLMTCSLTEGFLQGKLAPSQTPGLMDLWRNSFLCAFVLFPKPQLQTCSPRYSPGCVCVSRSGHPLPPLASHHHPAERRHPRPCLLPSWTPPCLHHMGSPAPSRPAPPRIPALPTNPLSAASSSSLPPSWLLATSMSMG